MNRSAFRPLALSATAAALLSASLLIAQDKTEPAKTEPAKADAQPAGDAPKAEAPKPDAPKADAPKAAAPKAEPKIELTPEQLEGEPAAPVDPAVAWKTAQARRLEIFGRLQTLSKDFQKAADNSAKSVIRDEYVDLIREFDTKIYPQMIELAPGVYEKDPANLDAAEIVMRLACNENQFDKTAEISTKLIAANRKARDILSMGGLAQYALHNFEQAAAILTEAKKLNRLDQRYENHAESAGKYVALWKAELELRAKEDALQGDMALPRVLFDTSRGKIVLELFEDHAPNTVANFISLVEAKKYDGIKFHRVIPGFMAQGGDPNTLNADPSDDGFGGPGYSIKCECFRPDARVHFSGSLSMAHSGRDSGGSQFFITHLPVEWLNPATEPQERGHTVFGRVIEGLDIARSLKIGDVITTATVQRKRPHEYKPEIKKDETEEAPADAPKTDASKTDDPKADAPKTEPVQEAAPKTGDAKAAP